jgi:hypothetical protein
MRCLLREVRDEDLPVRFEQWADPVAAHMAAFATERGFAEARSAEIREFLLRLEECEFRSR